jgi:hypothetical protein
LGILEKRKITNYQLFRDLTSICSSSVKSFSSSPIFVIDTINRDYLIREIQPVYIVDEQKSELQIKRKLNLETSCMEEEWKFYDKRRNKGKKRKVSAHDPVHLSQILNLHLNFRAYSLHELIKLLKQTGWNCVSKYGDLITLEPFNRASRNIVLVSQKEHSVEAPL